MKKIFCVIYLAAWMLVSAVVNSQTVDGSNWDLLVDTQAQEIMEEHQELNSIFWKNEQLYPNIDEKFNQMGRIYFKKLADEMPGVELKDIVFIGSMADYLYTSNSDLDINLLIDTSKVRWPSSAIGNYLKLSNKYWHTQTTTLSNYPIEMGAYTQLSTLGGIYSILNHSWLKHPEHHQMNFSKESLINIVQANHIEIVALYQEYTNNPKQFDCSRFNTFQSNLIKWRKDGLQREGLASIENTGYRLMRNLGELDLINELSTQCLYG